MSASTPTPLRMSHVRATWWPLAASWLLMGFELPLVSAVMARLPQPTLSLAAYGGVVFPLAMLIEGPIVMLLAASTALSRDRAAHRLIRRFALGAGGTLSALHALVAFTPLYDLLVVPALGVPPEIREPARIGLRFMTPWTVSIAYRRFQQGVLIRFERSRLIGYGTLVRLGTNGLTLAIGALVGTLPAIVVGTLAVAVGVVCEAAFAGFAVHPVLARDMPERPSGPALDLRTFLAFYVPLALTPILMFLAMPLASAAMTRMPLAIASLAAWPVLNGLVFSLRSVGFAMNEVVVALVDRPGAVHALRRFTVLLAASLSGLLLLTAVTPIGAWWFGGVSALPPNLVSLARSALWVALPLPGLTAFMSWYQGVIVHGRRTRGVTESVTAYLVTMSLALTSGVLWRRPPGIEIAAGAMVMATLAQVLWLRARAQAPLAALADADLAEREAALAPIEG